MLFWFFPVYIAGYEPGPYFSIDSSISVIYTTYSDLNEEKADKFEKGIKILNPILVRAESGIEWTRGIDTDFSKFAEIDFEPRPEIYSIKWQNQITITRYDRVPYYIVF